MKKFLKTLSIYGISLFILLNLIAFLCLYSLEKSSFYKQQFIKNGLSETSFDYVILGSSTGLTTLDSKQIDSTFNLKGLNISIDDSGLSSHYLILKQFYDYGYRTNKMILCVTPNDISESTPVINGNDYRFLPHARDKNVKLYFNEMQGDNKWIYQSTPYVPLVGVSYFNSELFFPAIIAALQPQRRNLFDDQGNYSYPVNKSFEKSLKKNEEVTNKVTIQNPYFFKIADFCQQNNIALLIYQSPIYNLEVIYDNSFSIINHSSLLKNADLFYDKIHVNKKGRVICSQTIGSYLLAN